MVIFFQFDSYLRSSKIDQNELVLVTDGQLPLRQCLHPSAGFKDIHLPSYYWKFSDLKKEVKSLPVFLEAIACFLNDFYFSFWQYSNSKSGDLSKALIPISDPTKLLQMPPIQQPSLSLSEILKGENETIFNHKIDGRAFEVCQSSMNSLHLLQTAILNTMLMQSFVFISQKWS